MNSLVLLRIHGDRTVDVRRYTADGTCIAEPCVHRRAVRELARLIAEAPAETCVAWCDVRIESSLADVRNWPGLLRHPLELLHLACFQRCDLAVGSLGFVDFSSCYLLPGPTDRRYVTWLISPMAGIARAELLRAARFDGRLPSLALALFDAGYRGLQWGVCPYSEPRLRREAPGAGGADAAGVLPFHLSNVETALLVRRILSRKWVWFWFAASLLFHRRFRGWAALRGLLAAAPPQVDINGFASLHRMITESQQSTSA